MEFGVELGQLNPAFFVKCTLEAERLGFESVWLPEHLVFTAEMSRSPVSGESHPPRPSTTPVFDAFAYLSFLAGITQHLRLGTHVYNIGLRHPFISARAAQTLDIVSEGRAEFGIGASWLEEEWIAAQLDFRTRGARVDEAIEVCKKLWTDRQISHHGQFFQFDDVVFEPKPVQRPWPPILVGGESDAALRRAARHGDGWIGLTHTFDNAQTMIARLQELLTQYERPLEGFQICLSGRDLTRDAISRWEELGVTRLLTAPWERSPDALDGLRRFAELSGLRPR